jgi:hypothetical protein
MSSITIPNSYFALPGNSGMPLQIDRNCELAVKYWTLKNDMYEMGTLNDKLRLYIKRLKVALKTSNSNLDVMRGSNADLSKELESLRTAYVNQTKELSEVQSSYAFQKRLIRSQPNKSKMVRSRYTIQYSCLTYLLFPTTNLYLCLFIVII